MVADVVNIVIDYGIMIYESATEQKMDNSHSNRVESSKRNTYVQIILIN